MSHNDDGQRVRVRGLERDEPDLRRLARALIDIAIEQAAQAQREDESADEDGVPSAVQGEAA